MFIAIEGCDGSGKSSLVDAIETEIRRQRPDIESVTRYHKGRPPEETRRCLLTEYVISLESDDLHSGFHLADRWHWGERTYAPIKRPHTNKDGYGLLGVAGWRWVELFMQSRGMAQFLLYQRLDTIKSRVTERGDDFIDVNELEAIYTAYKETARVAILAETIMPGDAAINKLQGFAAHIIDVASAVSKRAAHLRAFPRYIGAVKPKVLLIGDQRNVTEEYGDETILPFMPVNGNSGDYLLSALPDDVWRDVGIVNGQEIEPSTLAELHLALGRPPIVALGRNAESAILKTTIHVDDYTVLPHPQFVRRFHNAEKESYGMAILDIANGKKVDRWELK